MRRTIILLISIFFGTCLFAQEFNCQVQVMHEELNNPDVELLRKMDQKIEEFMNNYTWTKHVFGDEEKINLNFNIRLTSQISNLFNANVQVQATRPVYGSTYTTPLINFLDENFQFKYDEFETLDFDINSFQSNLTSVLAYYAYVVLGLDYDSFSLNGGTEFYQLAQNIVNNSQSGGAGWKASENRTNRYWLVEDILNSSYSGFRSCLYTYHRLGLDVMSSKVEDGRKKIEASLNELEKVYNIKPGAFIIDFFFYAKSKELVNIFSEAMPDEKKRVALSLKKMNPANASDYSKIEKE